ncbi:hypothetical protein ACLKA6_017274 [Drosophila palustris]
MSTAFLMDSLLHAQRAQSYSESQLKSMLLSRGQTMGEQDRERDRQETEHSSELCAKRGYKCDKCRENRAESVDSIEEMEMQMEMETEMEDDEDDDDDDDDEIVADIDGVDMAETTHLHLDEDLDDDEPIKLPKLEPKLETSSTTAKNNGTTILKDNNSKPILKFSVSAILGDTREGVRVRNAPSSAASASAATTTATTHHQQHQQHHQALVGQAPLGLPHPLHHHAHAHAHAHAHFPHPAFLTHQQQQHHSNSCQPQTTATTTASSSSPGSTISDSDNNHNNNNNNSNSNNFQDARPHEIGTGNDEDNSNRRLTQEKLQQQQQQQQQQQLLSGGGPPTAHPTPPPPPPPPPPPIHPVIAKPMPSRPTPFLPHTLNHPHLHSLLAHCRNPYMSVGAQVFPLPPGQGFPWAHSTRGKPRRGMMRRAVFSDSQRKGLEKRFQQQKYISKPDRKKLAERLGLKDSQNRDSNLDLPFHLPTTYHRRHASTLDVMLANPLYILDGHSGGVNVK